MTASNNYSADNKHYSQHRQGARKTIAYCKICHDAGRPKHEYTSHFVKDKKGPDGKVVCPLLLNQECRYCHEKGHTPKECPHIKAKAERNRQFEERRRDFKTRPDADGFRTAEDQRHMRCFRNPASNTSDTHEVLTAKLKSTNLFAALRDSSSDEEETKSSDAFTNKPAPAVVVPSEPKLTGWAALAAKPAALPKHVVRFQKPPTVTRDAWDNESECSDYSEDEEELTQHRTEWNREYNSMKGMSWADMCDSDDEE